jgi:hypothetical protein
METTATILSALASLDSGSIVIPLDDALYSEGAIRTFLNESQVHYTAKVSRSGDTLQLELIALDPGAARLQIGEALTDLLRHALRCR